MFTRSRASMLYKSLPYLHGIFHLAEIVVTLFLLGKVTEDPDMFYHVDESYLPGNNNSISIEQEKLLPIFGGLFVVDIVAPNLPIIVIVLVLCLELMMFCLPLIISKKVRYWHLALLFSKPLHRCISINCNCPCYQARPKLRFQMRFAYSIVTAIIRIVVIVGLSFISHPMTKKYAYVVAISFAFWLVHVILDFYHYRAVWHYKPYEDDEETGGLSKKHKRYIPGHLLGSNRDGTIGNRLCKNTVFCANRQLEHIMIFHSMDYQPQPRWSKVRRLTKKDIYIGFHQTKPESAVKIAHSDFRPSMTPPQMLGFGIYFARSISSTSGKARSGGAFICAEIHMGKVRTIEKSEIPQVQNSNDWWKEYDTIYYKHKDETKDEFCIKSSSQIIRWVILINPSFDPKVSDYGMDTEYADTACGCC